jgi:hypothetical protein
MHHEVRGDPNSTETCCEEFRPSACAGQDRHQWRSVTDDGVSGLRQARTVGFSHPSFVADRPASTEPRSCVKHLCSRRPRSHPGRPLGARPTPLWDFGRSDAAAVKGRFAGLRPPLTAADYLLETPAPVLRITHVTPAPYRILFESRPPFPVLHGAIKRAVTEGHDGVGFHWVRE